MNNKKIYNKYYRHLRQNVFDELDIQEFMEVYLKFKRLKIQYKLLKIENILEKINIPTLEIPIIRLFYKVSGFYALENI